MASAVFFVLVVHHTQVAVQARVAGIDAQRFLGVLAGLGVAAVGEVGARQLGEGDGVGGVEGIGSQQRFLRQVELAEGLVGHAQVQVQVGDVLVDGQGGLEFLGGFFQVLGVEQDDAARPVRFQQVRVQG